MLGKMKQTTKITNNINAEGKRAIEMQTPVDDSRIFTKVSRSSRFPLVLVGAPRKGQALSQVTPWIALGLLHAQVGLQYAFWQASPGSLLAVFTIKLLAKPPRALFPSVHGGGHTTNAVSVISQDYKPLRCTTMVRASIES